MKNIPRINRIYHYRIRENEEGRREDKLNDIENDNLKNKLRLSKDTISSLRREIKNLKSKNHIDRNSMKDNAD